MFLRAIGCTISNCLHSENPYTEMLGRFDCDFLTLLQGGSLFIVKRFDVAVVESELHFPRGCYE